MLPKRCQNHPLVRTTQLKHVLGSETHPIEFAVPPYINEEGPSPHSRQSATSLLSFPFLTPNSFLTHRITSHFLDSGQKVAISKAMRELSVACETYSAFISEMTGKQPRLEGTSSRPHKMLRS